MKTDQKFSKWIRSLDTCIAGGVYESCGGIVHSCHVTTETYLGKNQKHPYRQVPMCAIHHTIQGNKGEREFYKPMGGVDKAISLGWILTGIYLANLERDIEAQRALHRWFKEWR